MYYEEIIRPKLLDFLGEQPHLDVATLSASLSLFIDNICTQELYRDLTSEEKDNLTTTLNQAQRNFKKPTTGTNPVFFETLHDLLPALKKHSTHFSALRRAFISRQNRPETIYLKLSSLSDRIDQEYKALIDSEFFVETGELRISELCFMTDLFRRSLTTGQYQKHHALDNAPKNLERYKILAKELGFLQRELTPLNDTKTPEPTTEHIADFVQTIAFDPIHIAEIGRYYVDTHNDRKNAATLSQLEGELDRVARYCLYLDSDIKQANIKFNDVTKHKRKAIPRPDSIETLIDEIEQNLGPTKKSRESFEAFKRKALNPPANFESVITRYYPEEKSIKKQRDSAFKSERKKKFVKSLASNRREELKTYYGASNEDVDTMLNTGTIPAHLDITIEHISDRKFGGTNHDYNLIAVPRKINEDKEKMIRNQLGIMSSPTKPVWIINWQPKRNNVGQLPDLYIPPTIRNTPPIDIDKACRDNYGEVSNPLWHTMNTNQIS